MRIPSNKSVLSKAHLLAAATAGILPLGFSPVDAATWVPTTGGTYGWEVDGNWNPAAHPDAAGATADLTTNITGNQNINLNGDKTVGTLNLGDSGAATSNAYVIQGGTPTGTLIFQSAAAGGATALNLSGAAAANNSINTNIRLGGTSSLTISQSGAQKLTTTGTTDINGNTLTIAGAGGGQVNLGIVAGTGKIVKNSSSQSFFNDAGNTFTGTLEVNQGNATLTGGSIQTFSGATINGALNASASTQLGGSLSVGDNSGRANPGQRLPTAGVTLNGGTLGDGGQNLSGGNTAVVTDNLDRLRFNSGLSVVNVTANTTSGGTLLHVTALQRGAGATAIVRRNAVSVPAKLTADNGATLLKGSGGTGTSQSIIPWMVVDNTNGSAAAPSSWATYGANGIVALASTDYDSTLAGTATRNVNSGSANLGNNATQTVNSFQKANSGASNIGTNSTLTVTSGAVLLTNNTGGIGAAGNAAAGTLNFGSAEGVIWAIGSNANTIGSVITGSGGLTKAGTGSLTLQGNNSYSGPTIVSGGTLRVGDGTNNSNLGMGNVSVANGAILEISSPDAIANNAILSLDQYGLFNGMALLDSGINETVGGLSLAGLAQLPGTYGSSASGATFQNDTFFSGSGVLTVVPEPASLSVLGFAGLVLLRKRRH